jgi:hypothetical protein
VTIAKPGHARGLPEYRNALVAADPLWEAMSAMGTFTAKGRDFEHAWHIRQETADARLWWVGEEACELLTHAAPTMPVVTLTRELVPDETGFVCFERPLIGKDADHRDVEVRVDFLSWFGSTVQIGGGVDCLSILAWQQLDEVCVPLGRADWPYGADSDSDLPVEMSSTALESIIEDRRVLAAMWQLSSQPSITDTEEVAPDRATQRRLARRGQPVAPVRVMNLASRQRSPAATGAAGGREYQRRWIVEGHWRQQACGPGWSQHRPVWIAPHVKGPEGKPLVATESVKVWKGT